jgi:hypothetical protein
MVVWVVLFTNIRLSFSSVLSSIGEDLGRVAKLCWSR